MEEQELQLNLEEFKLLKDIPDQKMKILFELYIKYVKVISLVRFAAIGVPATIMISKLLFGGKSYTHSEYNNIMTVTIVIACIFCLTSIILGISSVKHKNILKKELREIVNKNKLPKAEFLLEFNPLIKHLFGGPGIKKI